MSENFGNGNFIKFASDAIYFVINYVTVGKLCVDGSFEIRGVVIESQVLPASSDDPVGYDSTRGTLYIALSDKTRVFEIDGNGDVEIAGVVIPDQTLTWSGGNYEIESDASDAWANIDANRVFEIDGATGDMELADHFIPSQVFIALPTILTLSHASYPDYEFPETFWFKTIPTKTRRKIARRAGGHGVTNIADGFLDERVIEVRGLLMAPTNAAYETLKDALYAAIYRTDLRLWTNFDRYLRLSGLTGTVKEKFLSGYWQICAEFTIQWICEMPFWVSSILTQQTESITSDPQTFNVVYAPPIEVAPLFKVTAAEDIVNLKIKNLTDSKELEYADGAFQNGEVVEIDCHLGTVELVGAGTPNRIDKISGQWLRLLPAATNQIKITGGNCSVVTEYRGLYL